MRSRLDRTVPLSSRLALVVVLTAWAALPVYAKEFKTPLEFQLNVASIFETVTVTPARGQPQEVFAVPKSPVVVVEDELSRRYANILPQALRDVTGVHIQQFAVAI
jgi:outer membrane receptor for Fe3+-dicitrate